MDIDKSEHGETTLKNKHETGLESLILQTSKTTAFDCIEMY